MTAPISIYKQGLPTNVNNMNLEPFKNKQRLLKIAETSCDEMAMEAAMKKLREMNPTYHWCPEWDYMVICDSDLEYQSCLCKSKKRDV